MDKKLRNIIIYITVAVMVVLGVAFLMTKNSSESYTTSQLVNLLKRTRFRVIPSTTEQVRLKLHLKRV